RFSRDWSSDVCSSDLVRVVLVAGLVVLAVGCALTPLVDDGFGLAVSLGLLASMGSGIGSFSVLIGAAAQRLPADARGAASGVIKIGRASCREAGGGRG